MIKLIALFTAILLSFQALALDGVVVGISDGDTLTLLADRQQVKIRLAEIDAPEKAQPFGQHSKESLSELCFGKSATVDVQGVDRYGRTIGRVLCFGASPADGVDANAEQVRRGLAWVYIGYARDRAIFDIEAAARAQRRGLWSDVSPVPPWKWRRK